MTNWVAAMTDRYGRLREEYEGQGLDGLESLDPLDIFRKWQDDAEQAGVPLSNAMALATADASGAPSVRMVLLKGVDERGRLWFFTDSESQKGRELAANPLAELLFYWRELHRQVRVRGEVERTSASESDAYFASRPRASNLSAIASHQSQVIGGGRVAIEEARAALEDSLGGAPLARPERWGGFALAPRRFEYWQGRPDRLHHRLVFEIDGEKWSSAWLAP